MTGHVFVIIGDLTQVACDARLIPTDAVYRIEAGFAPAVGLSTAGRLFDETWQGPVVREYGRADVNAPCTYLANIGGVADSSPERFVEAVDAFSQLAAADLPSNPGRKTVLALPVLGSGAGGSADRKGTLHPPLAEVLQQCARRDDVDLVLVCHDARAYAAAQRARRNLLSPNLDEGWRFGGSVPNADLTAHARRLGRELRDGNLVLFFGAGASAGAGLPSWQQLLDDLAATADLPAELRVELPNLDPRDQATVIARRLADSGRSLRDELDSRMRPDRYSLTHGLLATFGVGEAVTTNFDCLYEEANSARDRPVVVLPGKPASADSPWLLKLHGSLHTGDTILTRAEYFHAPLLSGALFGIVQAMMLTRHVLFVGYSLVDEDFRDLVEEVRFARRPRLDRDPPSEPFGTVITLSDNPALRALWDEDLTVVALSKSAADDSATDDPGRRAAMFLDRVAFESADLGAFLLDSDYRDMRTDEEQRLAEVLGALDLSSRDEQRDDDASATWAEIRRFVERFGA